MQTCPNCNSDFDWNDPQSSHQVNDNTEQTCCSYECSAVITLKFLSQELSKCDLNNDRVRDIILNT